MPHVTTEAFVAWLEARGVKGTALAVYEAGANRVLSYSGDGPVLPSHVEAAALKATGAGASTAGIANLRKIGTALMAFQREKQNALKPRLTYCERCKMSFNADTNPGCPYCRTPGFAGLMNKRLADEQRARDQKEMMARLATMAFRNLGNAAGDAAGDAATIGGLDADIPDFDGGDQGSG